MHRNQTRSNSIAIRSLPRNLFRAALVVLAFSACAHGPQTLEPREVTITLLQTTDFHGALESESRDRNSDRPIGGAAFLTALLEKERSTRPGTTLTLDSGDIYQGTALSNLTDGRATIDYMNAAGFDAAAIGNHEFDYGVDLMLDRMEQAKFPILSANIIERATGKRPSWAQPYAIFDRQGVRIAVIGISTPDTPNVTLPQNVAHLDFPDPVSTANELIRELVPEKADLVVILCHMGGFQRSGAPIEGELVELAEGIEGEHAILGGHTHRIVAGKVGGTAIAQAGSSGRWIGRIELRYDRVSRQVIDSTSDILTVFADSAGEGSVLPDEQVSNLIDGYRTEIASILDEEIGNASVDLSTERAECPMGNWITDLMRETTRADVAFQNPGGIRSSISSGPIRYTDVYRVMPFDNTVVVAELTGEELAAYVGAAARRGDILHTSGLRYAVDFSLPEDSRVTDIRTENGSPIDPAGTYRIAVNNFMASGGSDLPELMGQPGAMDTGLLVRDLMIDGCREATAEGRSIARTVEGRIQTRQ